jgi:phosphatidylserine/phosphatidylglycerophosphate/cardiolipin synthase-like enzyme
MLVKVHFSKIRHEIVSLLKKSTSEINLAVAWLTDEDILRELGHRAKAGIKVKIAISNAKENFVNITPLSNFLSTKGQLFVSTKSFLHHKFCLIDGTVLINGSYNWSYPARYNEENIMILTRDADSRDDNLVFENFKVKHNFLCDKCGVNVPDVKTLNAFGGSAVNSALVQANLDEAEIKLRQQFQDRIKQSVAKALSLRIPISPSLLERMEADGGGVEFVKRILHDEMTSGDMKSGFKKLEEFIPHKVELSLEFLVIQPQFLSLFAEDELTFCKKLMAKYNL